MYHAIVRSQIRKAFSSLSAGDDHWLMERMAPDVRHSFPGDSSLGGERHSRADVAAWFSRLHRLFPGHRFLVERVVASGWPWDTWVAVAWSAELVPAQGEPYQNQGAHWLHIRWGKVREFHAYLDTERIARACAQMASSGIEEATAAPIL